MALTGPRHTRREDTITTPETIQRAVQSGAQVYLGGMVCSDPNGELVPAGDLSAVTHVLGRAELTVLGDGAITCRVTAGCFWYDNSGSSIDVGDLYRVCYAVDDEAVHQGDAGGARQRAGIIVDVDAALGVCVLMSPYLSSMGVSENILRRAVSLTSADLTAAGLTQTINIGGVVSVNAMLCGYRMSLTDAFDSPGAGSLDIQLGDTVADDDAICAAFDGYTGSVAEGAGWQIGVPGVSPYGPATGTQLAALFTATVDNLNTFTNGDVDIEIFYREVDSYL